MSLYAVALFAAETQIQKSMTLHGKSEALWTPDIWVMYQLGINDSNFACEGVVDGVRLIDPTAKGRLGTL